MRKLLLPVLIAAPLIFAGCSPSAEKLNNTGNEAFASQDYEQALAAYQQAEAESPELAEPHFNAANAHYRQENFDGARQEIEQALVKEKGDLTQDSFYNLGNSFYQAKDYEQAIEAYKETLRLNPDDAEAKHNLELALQQMQQDQ
ncbi:MAG TPA: tetratricopeptide repeat protein, partial [Anaerolineae bacterium]|nr:tetratricopeptide repeat protein [Anaerolineae bacterium]